MSDLSQHAELSPVAPKAAARLAAWRGDAPGALAYAGLVAGLAWSPFWLGGNRPLAWGVNALYFGALAFCYETALLVRRRGHPIGLRAIAAPALMFGLAAVYAWVQSWGAPESLAHPIWALASEALGGALVGSVSVNGDLTSLALVRLTTEALVFWLALQACRNEQRATALVGAAALVGVAYAAWGLYAFATQPGQVLWFDNPLMKAYVTSTFVNRNSYATYAGLGLVCVAALIFNAYREGATAGSFPLRLAQFFEASRRGDIWLFFAAVILLAALLATGSRGGIVATGLAVLALGALTAARMRRRRRSARALLVFASVAAAGLFALFGDLFAERLLRDGVYDAGRPAVYALALDMIAKAPLAGYGYGAFADVFPLFRDRSLGLDGYWDKAHNVYLEAFVGLGLVAGGLLVASLAALSWRCVKGALARRRAEVAPMAAAAASVLVGVHALVDFSLQLQAVAILYAALLGAGVAQATSSREPMGD